MLFWSTSNDSKRTDDERFVIWPLALALLAVLILPLLHIRQSLWIDEASSVWFAHKPVTTLLSHLCDPHPPGYYLLLKGWMIFGENEVWLRLPSLLASAVTVILTHSLARRVCHKTCSAWATLLLAIQPIFLWYATEARMYALATALGVLVVWLGWQLLSSKHLKINTLTVAYWLMTLIAGFVDYTALLPVFLLQLIWLARRRPHGWRWLALQITVLAPLILAWMFSPQRYALHDSYHAVFLAVQAHRFGLQLTPDSARMTIIISTALVMGGSLLFAWAWAHWPRTRKEWWGWQVLLLFAWLFLLLFAAIPRLYTIKRLLVVFLPYLAIAVATILAQQPRWLRYVLAAIGLALSLFVLTTHAQAPWSESITTLDIDSNDIVWVDELAVPVVDYYTRKFELPFTYVPLFGRQLPDLPQPEPELGADLWLITAEGPYRDLQSLLPTTFYARYQLLNEYHTDGIGVYHYFHQLQSSSVSPMIPPQPTQQQRWGLQLPSPLDTCHSSGN